MFHGYLDDSNFENTKNELSFPPLPDIFKFHNLIPLIGYFLFFRLLAFVIKNVAWQNSEGFKQYRLQNLTICLIHSVLSGGFVFIFAITNPYAMFVQPIHWYQDWSRHVLLFSISYFAHDALDMLRYEVSKFTIELIGHHACSAFIFIAVVTSRKFIPFAFLALMMEVNSVFLHIRTLMRLSGNSTQIPQFYKLVQMLNLITFVVMRFGIQAWQALYLFKRRRGIHEIWVFIGLGGCLVFFIINGFLFVRILAAEGYLGEFGRKHAAINRDDSVKQIGTEKTD